MIEENTGLIMQAVFLILGLYLRKQVVKLVSSKVK